ncbi:hypothetical protein FOA52_005726 [Chlamydomonas sp. UWO 241]|nr:hypothetical protein FOA52_005726 [Chlamydomonas sp. UWO 241]
MCTSKADGQRYVKKVVRLARQSNKERQASLRELRILSNIRHRNVLRYVEAWVESGCAAVIITELCECGDLQTQMRTRLPEQRHFNEAHLQDMLVQLASSLDHLHSNGIAHRDVKSSNVFVSDTGCLKLADFGLATILDESTLMSTTVCGTPNYMGPEIMSECAYGVKNDMWAMGCVMYELSALKPAFQAFNMSALVKKITHGPTPALPSMYSEEWRECVRWMLCKDEVLRPSAADILALPWLQDAVARVNDRHGPALPPGSDSVIEVHDLPPTIARLAEQFEAQDRDAELHAAKEAVHHKEQQLKFAPTALRARWEDELCVCDARHAGHKPPLQQTQHFGIGRSASMPPAAAAAAAAAPQVVATVQVVATTTQSSASHSAAAAEASGSGSGASAHTAGGAASAEHVASTTDATHCMPPTAPSLLGRHGSDTVVHMDRVKVGATERPPLVPHLTGSGGRGGGVHEGGAGCTGGCKTGAGGGRAVPRYAAATTACARAVRGAPPAHVKPLQPQQRRQPRRTADDVLFAPGELAGAPPKAAFGRRASCVGSLLEDRIKNVREVSEGSGGGNKLPSCSTASTAYGTGDAPQLKAHRRRSVEVEQAGDSLDQLIHT